MINITLSWYEVSQAAKVGCQRQIQCLIKEMENKANADHEFDWDNHIQGAAGEMAFARAFNLYWSYSVNKFKVEGDVCGIEIKTRLKHSYDLLIRPGDPKGRRNVLVTGMIPHLRIHGWLHDDECRLDKYWRDDIAKSKNRPPAWFIPKNVLNPLETVLKP